MSNPVIVFNKSSAVSIPMTEKEVDEEFLKILEERQASEEVKNEQLAQPLLTKYNIVMSYKKNTSAQAVSDVYFPSQNLTFFF